MGPLKGVKIIEFAGIGPGPFCGMMLSDMGAEVIRVDRPGREKIATKDGLSRGRRSIVIDLKSRQGVDLALLLIAGADGLIEGYRPGVMERLGLAPEICLARNSKLIYGRMTGWGQEGPLAHAAGHDPNYIALAGVLNSIGPKDQAPVLPLNLIGDFGGGGLLLAFGMVAALFESTRSGKGQVIDAAMVDGAATLATLVYAMYSQNQYRDERGTNALNGGSHFNQVYECKDGGYISICSLEPQFYEQLLSILELDADYFSEQMNPEKWPEYTLQLQKIFRTKTRHEWCETLEGSDVCFAPVLTLAEAPEHPHNKFRHTFVQHDGFLQPAPSPRFSRTKAQLTDGSVVPGTHSRLILQQMGFSEVEIDTMIEAAVIETGA
ncbi:MAG: CaiB/BaiF CoA-transferase family protein [Gammaproteobacteria bacterium]|nr:CaiB/BaiF CoA-transferase family protein [Gammaproteobacteria bacterium]